jgi:zona occludens toxin
MAIVLYSGLPGAGKSYSVVEYVLLPALKQGRAVYTNIKLNIVELAQEGINPLLLPLPAPGESHGWETLAPGAVVVIDEAWQYWSSGTKASAIPEPEKQFFAMHRHKQDAKGRSQSVVLVTQNPEQLASYVRGLVDKHFRAHKLDAVGAANRFRLDIYNGCTDREKDLVRSVQGKYKKEVYKFYTSHTFAQVTDVTDVDERSIDDRASVWKNPAVLFGIPGGFLALVVAGFLVVGQLSAIGGEDPDQVELSTTPNPENVSHLPHLVHQVPISKPEPAQVVPVGPALSREWRLVAEMRSDSKAFLVAAGRGGLRHIDPADCETRTAGETWCLLEGEYVTTFTGPQSHQQLAVAPIEHQG